MGTLCRRRRPAWTMTAGRPFTLALAFALALTAPLAAQQNDEGYTNKIRAYTTEPFFLTPYVDHLPASATVPTPEQVLGHVIGAPDVLTYPADIYRYMRAVAAASPRVKVFSMGTTEEGREQILVVVSDSSTMARLDDYKAMLARLADPRRTSATEADQLIAAAKPIYWATGSIHSPETGSPEMLMELVYRLAVEETPFIKAIRDGAIFMTTPVIEVDGRAKEVDVAMASRKDSTGNYPSRLVYWGKYVAHDNNRDGIGLALKLSQNVTRTFLEWQPTVVHDLHESASYLYTSTGRGPYNAWVDPIVINEWNRLAYKEVQDMTALGVPGIYTHDYYDGWAPNYMFWVANMRNSIGRFYETQGAGNASTRVLNSNVQREWHRPNTPLRQVVWSIRNNVNLQQSALLIALHEVATNHETYLRDFWLKSKRSVAKATTEGPAAYIFPATDPRPGQQARLLRLLQEQGIEVQRASAPITIGDGSYPTGSYVVRMDQPYSRAADMLLDRQYYNPNDPRPYDDTGWTLGPLFNVNTVRITDPAILSAPMTLMTEPVTADGGVGGAATAAVYLIDYNADNELTSFRYRYPQLKIDAAEEGFDQAGHTFHAGSFIIRTSGNPSHLRSLLDQAGKEYGFLAFPADAVPSVATHPVTAARVAVLHTWQSTQTEGWLRLGLDQYSIPFDYISVQDVRDNPRLHDRYDVILFGPAGDALSVLHGLTGDQPMPWKKTAVTPNLGRQASTDDMRGGLELQGVLNLQRFVQQGGTFVAIGNSASLPLQFGLVDGLQIRDTQQLWAPGGVFRAVVADHTSPIVYGYGDALGVYFNRAPVFGAATRGFRRFAGAPGGSAAASDGSTTARHTGRGAIGEQDIVQGRPPDPGKAGVDAFRHEHAGERQASPFGRGPSASHNRIIFRFSPDVKDLLISGGLDHGAELANAPALVDAPLGDGHVVLFSFNPFWRSETLGSYALVFNTLLHHASLGTGQSTMADQ